MNKLGKYSIRILGGSVIYYYGYICTESIKLKQAIKFTDYCNKTDISYSIEYIDKKQGFKFDLTDLMFWPRNLFYTYNDVHKDYQEFIEVMKLETSSKKNLVFDNSIILDTHNKN